MPSRARRALDRAVALCIVGFTVLCGSVSLIYPFGRDQGSYAYAGWVLLDGGVPYRDVFVFKPPMTVVVHALAIGLFGVNTWAIRVLDLGWTAATALVVAAIALELWNRRDAALAAGLLCPFLYYQIDYWTTAQTDGWMTLPCAAAVWAVLLGGRVLDRNTWHAVAWWVAAGVFAGAAVLFKYTAGLIGIPLLVALAWVGAAHGRRAWIGIPVMVMGGVITLAACCVWLVSTGAWAPFLDSQLNLLPDYIRKGVGEASVQQTLVRLFTLKGTKTDLVPLVCAGPIGLLSALLVIRPNSRATWLGLGVALIWWLVAAGNVVVQGKFFDYHYLPLIAPSALLAGLGFAALLSGPLSRFRWRGSKAFALATLIVFLIAATPLGVRARELLRVTLGPQTMDEYISGRGEYSQPAYDVGEIRRVAELLRNTTTPDQRVFVWGYEPTINVRARRRTVSRFLFNFPLRMTWRNPMYESELMEALRARPPDAFVVASGDRYRGLTGTLADSAALLSEFEDLDAFVRERYEPAETVGRYLLWRLKQ